jgi:hypothetical protein
LDVPQKILVRRNDLPKYAPNQHADEMKLGIRAIEIRKATIVFVYADVKSFQD